MQYAILSQSDASVLLNLADTFLSQCLLCGVNSVFLLFIWQSTGPNDGSLCGFTILRSAQILDVRERCLLISSPHSGHSCCVLTRRPRSVTAPSSKHGAALKTQPNNGRRFVAAENVQENFHWWKLSRRIGSVFH